jgi:hypothetical protein
MSSMHSVSTSCGRGCSADNHLADSSDEG